MHELAGRDSPDSNHRCADIPVPEISPYCSGHIGLPVGSELEIFFLARRIAGFPASRTAIDIIMTPAKKLFDALVLTTS